MLENVSFPGVESASMTLLPAPFATQLYKVNLSFFSMEHDPIELINHSCSRVIGPRKWRTCVRRFSFPTH